MGSGASTNSSVKYTEKWKKGKKLGEGSFGVVSLFTKIDPADADLKDCPETVAIKLIDKTRQPPEEVELLQLEVDIMMKVDHPNCVRMYQFYDTPTQLAMVLDLCTGGELFERIVEKEKYSEKEAALVVKQVADALGYLHSMGIVHRDLKPENLLYADKSDESMVKITDFGLAKLTDAGMGDNSMQTACGTPGYVAPEIILTGTEGLGGYGAEVDLWSLGVILYILLCGFPPFYEDSNPELFEKIKKGEYDFPADPWDEISADAKDLVSKLLVVEPTERATVDDVKNHEWVASASDKVINASVTDGIKGIIARSRYVSRGGGGVCSAHRELSDRGDVRVVRPLARRSHHQHFLASTGVTQVNLSQHSCDHTNDGDSTRQIKRSLP